MNEQQFNKSSIDVSPWLSKDVKLIEKAGEIGLFYYGPRFWMMGENEPLKSLANPDEIDGVINRIIQVYPKYTLNENHPFYRVRINPKVPHDYSEYDSPPDECCIENRFAAKGDSILFGSPDLELCLHECRIRAEDDIYVAKLIPQRRLNVLDLSALIEEGNISEFESLDTAIHFLFMAGTNSYLICRLIAKRIKEAGYDGIIYPSYFSYLRTGHVPFETVYGMSIRRLPELQQLAQSQTIPNIALFGKPIKEEKLTVHSINRILLNSVKYNVTFGPAFHKAEAATLPKDEYLKKRTKEYEEGLLKLISEYKK